MTLIGSPGGDRAPFAPRVVAAAVVLAAMVLGTLLYLAALVVGTGSDPAAGLTYQIGLMWTLMSTIGAVTGAVVLARRWLVRHSPWRAAGLAILAGVGGGATALLVGLGLALAVYRFAGV